jgi:hypothetical protein
MCKEYELMICMLRTSIDTLHSEGKIKDETQSLIRNLINDIDDECYNLDKKEPKITEEEMIMLNSLNELTKEKKKKLVSFLVICDKQKLFDMISNI